MRSGMNAPELTIGIPTYNGQGCLSSVLESIIREAKGKNVEIIVMDNASVDETPNIAKDFQSRYPDMLRYFRNEHNVGFDANVDAVVRQAKGRFVWLMADDDYLLPGAVDRVLKVIHDHPELAIIFTNFSNWIELGLKENVYCEDGNQFFAVDHFKNGLISSNIVNRDLWLDLDMKRFDGCLWIHFAYSIQAMAPKAGRKGFVIHQELLEEGGTERWGGGGTSLYVGLKLVRLFSDMESMGYLPQIKKEGDLVIKGRYPREISWAKINGLKVDLTLLIQMKKMFGNYPSFWIVDVPMLLVPKWFYIIVYKKFYAAKDKRNPA
jgi:glycosyltransferase involved in cell wall biosynthesis